MNYAGIVAIRCKNFQHLDMYRARLLIIGIFKHVNLRKVRNVRGQRVASAYYCVSSEPL